MRYPLPYAFARTHQLLVEDGPQGQRVWHAGEPDRGALGEIQRRYGVLPLVACGAEELAQRISAACSARFGCTTSRSVPSTRKRTALERS